MATTGRQTGIVDEDDISLSSTESETYESGTEFTVDQILAEKGTPKNKYYLISWEGYPEEKSTWEPEANVGSNTLEEWAERLELEEKGLEERFDVAKFEALVQKAKDEKEDRQKRRNAKRHRIKAAKLELLAAKRRRQAAKDDSDSSSEAVEENEVENAPGMRMNRASKGKQSGAKQQFKRPIKHASYSAIDDNLSDAEVDRRTNKRAAGATARSPSKAKRRQSDSSSEEVPLAQHKEGSRPRPASTSGSAVQPRRPAEILEKPAGPSLLGIRATSGNLPVRGHSSARGGKGATRGGSRTGNVFQTGEAKDKAKESRTLLKNATDPSKGIRGFTTMRQQFLAAKQGRSLADRAPDIEATGGLFDPSKPIQPIDPTTIRKPTKKPSESGQPVSEPEAVPTPVYQYSQPKSSREVCFFWHRNQQNSLEHACVNKYNCDRYHNYEPGAAISSAPPNYVWTEPKSTYSGPIVCWSWHRKQIDSTTTGCNNGDSCPRLHEYREGAPINPRRLVYPPGEVRPHLAGQGQDDTSMLIDHEDLPHHDKPDVLPPWEEPVAPAVRPTHSAPHRVNTGVHPPRPLSLESEPQPSKPDVHPPWKEPGAVGSQSRPYRSTCFFWDLAQKNSGSGSSCRHGSGCTHLHAYEPGVPVAPSPAGNPMSRSVHESPNTTGPQAHFQPPVSIFGTTTGPADGLAPFPLTTSSTSFRQSGPPERPAWDPQNPSNAICHFWHERGNCTKGNSCAYFHSSDEHLPVAPSVPEQQRIKRQTSCRVWLAGNCSKVDCRYMHGPQGNAAAPESALDRPNAVLSREVASDGASDEPVPFTEEPESMPLPPCTGEFGDRYFRGLPPTDLLGSLITPSRAKPSAATASSQQGPPGLNSSSSRPSAPPKRRAWNPRDATNAVCHFWNLGKCAKPDCEYLHSADPTLPVAPHPFDTIARPTCPLWAEKKCPKTNAECPYLHDTTSFVPGSGRPSGAHDVHRAQELGSSQDETPAGPRTKSIRFADEPPIVESRRNSPAGSTASLDKPAFARGDTGTVCRNLKAGHCVRGAACHCIHDDNSRQSPRHRDSDYEMLDAPRDTPTGSNQDPLPFKRMAKNDPPQDDTVSSNIHTDIDMLQSEVTQLDVGKSASTLPDQSTAPVKQRKVSMGDYKKQNVIANVEGRAKNVVLGYDELHSAFFDFGEMESEQEPWKQEFSTTARFVFNQLCMAQDLKAQQGLLHRRALKHGTLQPADPNNPALLKFVDHIAEELILRVGGLLTTCENFAILIYPSKREEWIFLEQSSFLESRLRYMIFKHDFKPGTQHLPAKLSFAEPYRTLLADKIQGMRLKNLLPYHQRKQNPYKFFLMFPKSEKQMVDFFSAWILASHAESQIFDSLSEGSWNYFVKNADGFGVIFIHESIAASLHRLSSLSRILKNSGIVIWNVSDSTSPYPLFPSVQYGPDPQVGRLRFTRLFPHGCAFLLTPSFIIAEPETSYNILNWFLNKKLPASTAGTWKLVCCYDFASYLLDLANAKAKEKDGLEQELKDNPARDAMLYKKKLNFRHCETRYKLYNALITWQLNHPRDDSDSDSDRNDDNESPLVQAPESIDQDDEEGLINWFAGWSMLKLDTCRKFLVIGTNSANVTTASRIKEIKVPKMTTKTVNLIASPDSLQKQKAREVATGSGASIPKPAPTAMELNTRENESDVSMDPDVPSPVTSRFPTNHGIDANQSEHVLALIVQTGCGAQDAHRILTQAKGNLEMAIELHKAEEFSAMIDCSIEDAQRFLTRAKGDVEEAGRLHRGETFDAKFDELMANIDPPRQLPPLEVGGSDLQRAQELLVSPAHSSRRSTGQPGPDSSLHSAKTDNITSRACIATSENGNHSVPRTNRPNNTIRPERAVRPGFVPEEDRAFYGNTRVVDGIPQYEIDTTGDSSKDVSRRTSLVMSPGELSLASHEGANGNDAERPSKKGRFEPVQAPQPQVEADNTSIGTYTNTDSELEVEMETVTTTKTFKATSVWYREMLAAGKSWQHMTVISQWDEMKKYLGM